METSKIVNIAIIADNALFSELLRKSVELNLGEPVTVDIFDSLEHFRKSTSAPHIVILDYVLGILHSNKNHGIDIIKNMGGDIPIIIISGKENMQDAAQTLQSGAHEFVLKDKFVFSHILNAVHGCLHPSRS